MQHVSYCLFAYDFTKFNSLTRIAVFCAGDPDGTKQNGKDPWMQCNTSTDCFKKLIDVESDIHFVVTFQVMGRYLLRKLSNCGKDGLPSRQYHLQ